MAKLLEEEEDSSEYEDYHCGVNPLFTGKAPALHSVCYIMNRNGKRLIKTRKGWQQFADRQAAKMQPLGFWHGVVCYVPFRNAYRIEYGGGKREG